MPQDQPRILVSWSSGKDSAWMLHLLKQAEQRGEVEVVALLTTLSASDANAGGLGGMRVSMHGVRSEVLHAQAQACGLDCIEIALPWPCPNHEYEARMSVAMERAKYLGVSHIAFGDLFLQDIRAYREEKLAGTGIAPLFPLWQRDTNQLAREMISGGLRAKIVSVDLAQLDASFLGREFDPALLQDLPATCDPCGEKGEFHTLVYDAPSFHSPLEIVEGQRKIGESFAHLDYLLR